MENWKCVLKLDKARKIIEGSTGALAAAVKQGADMRISTTFNYSEHMSEPDSSEGLVRELMKFPVSYWLDGDHSAGIQTTRYPADCSFGFLDLPSLSFFLNNDNGQNGIARIYLDGKPRERSTPKSEETLYKIFDSSDSGTIYPSENFSYEFDHYCWWVNDSWQQVLFHDSDGKVIQGSLEALQDAQRNGRRLKVGVRNLCADLAQPDDTPLNHEVFVELHSIYSHEDSGFLGGESDPIIRVAPSVPLKYKSHCWNYGWILPRTDGIVHHLITDPAEKKFIRKEGRYAIKWFVQ